MNKYYLGYRIVVKLPFQEDIFYIHIAIDEKILCEIQDFSQANHFKKIFLKLTLTLMNKYLGYRILVKLPFKMIFFICTLPLMKKYLGYRILVQLLFHEDLFKTHIATDEKIFGIQDFSQVAIQDDIFYMHTATDEKIF